MNERSRKTETVAAKGLVQDGEVGPLTVLVSYPPEPPDDLISMLRAVSPRLEVVCCPYEEDPRRRSARGRGDDADLARFPQPSLTEAQRAALGRADVMLAFDLPLDMESVAPGVRWVQAIGAGTDHYRNVKFGEGALVTSAAGVAAVPIAEFVMARLLMIWKRFDELADMQSRREWKPAFGRLLAGCTIGVVGMGAIGSAVANLAKAFGMSVLGVRRDPNRPSPQADEVFGPGQLHKVLRRSHAVVLCAPSTPETQDLFDAAAFEAMRPGAVFCNVARGSMVDENALQTALVSGHLRAAILDVTKIEPLPADSPLWDAPNLYLSPHSSASLEGYLERLFGLFADNLHRYLRDESLRNVVA